jgi:serine phosphatase RsbU (regulator of sigma subunit)
MILRSGGEVEHMRIPKTHGLGGRASARPVEQTASLGPGDRLVMVSDGVTAPGEGQAGLGDEGLVQAALRSRPATAADTVREIHKAVLATAGGELTDDATAVCMSVE